MQEDLIRAVIVAAKWKRAFMDSNPDGGMGPSDASILDEVLEEIGISLTGAQYRTVLEAMR